MQQLNKISILETVALMRDSAHTIREVCRKANSSVNEAAPFSSRTYTFLKMQQLNKISILETVALMRGTRIRQSSSLRVSKLAVFFSRAILAAENKPSLKCNS